MKIATPADIKIGVTRLRNNDPRYAGKPNEYITPTAFEPNGVSYNSGRRSCTIKFARIFTDGGARHQGYNVVID